MHRGLFVVCSMCLSISGAMAQGKVDSQWNCGKATDGHSVDVGDQPGHAYAISQLNCTAAKGEIEGVKEKEGVVTEFDEVKGNAVRFHGVFVETLGNGDKLHFTYAGTGKMEKGQLQTATEKWSLVSAGRKVKGGKSRRHLQGQG